MWWSETVRFVPSKRSLWGMTRWAGRGDGVVALLQALSDDELRQWDEDRGW